MTGGGGAKVGYVEDAQLRAHVEEVLGRHFRRRYPIVELQRRRSRFSSSFPLVILDVHLQNGRHLPLVVKNLSPRAMLDDARQARLGFDEDPHRELSTYRRFLSRRQLGTATYYGAVADDTDGRYLLFLERVSGPRLQNVGEFDIWRAVAA